MKKALVLVFLFSTVISLMGCASREVVQKTDDEIAAATATAVFMLSTIPADVPISPAAINLKVGANNTYISYEVPGTVDEVVAYYRAEFEAQEWQRRGNSPEIPIGGAMTMLRYKPKSNMSVTIQSIPESPNVRVLISVIALP